MGKVWTGPYFSMSLDGFIAGPNASREQVLGEGGDRLFQWYSSGTVDYTVPSGTMTFNVSPESAVEQAKAVAGEKDVGVGAASIAQQCITAGLLDEIHIDLVPVLLGNGVRLFEHLGGEPIELERTRVIEAPGVTHMTFRVVK